MGKIARMVIFRDARREDVPSIVALLADDMLGASREAALDDAYWRAFDRIAADANNRLIVAEADGQTPSASTRRWASPLRMKA